MADELVNEPDAEPVVELDAVPVNALADEASTTADEEVEVDAADELVVFAPHPASVTTNATAKTAEAIPDTRVLRLIVPIVPSILPSKRGITFGVAPRFI